MEINCNVQNENKYPYCKRKKQLCILGIAKIFYFFSAASACAMRSIPRSKFSILLE